MNPRYAFISVDYERKGGVWKVASKMAYWG